MYAPSIYLSLPSLINMNTIRRNEEGVYKMVPSLKIPLKQVVNTGGVIKKYHVYLPDLGKIYNILVSQTEIGFRVDKVSRINFVPPPTTPTLCINI